MDVASRVEQYMQQQKWALAGSKVVVAVSGGPDSVALLYLLHRCLRGRNCTLIVAHVHHHLRAEEADEDERFVRQLAASLACAYEVCHLDLRAVKDGTGNLQNEARRARYRFLAELAQRTEASYVATAHHFDDVAETVLMRLFRGMGSVGAHGIPVARKLGEALLIRPLLTIEKQMLLDFLDAEGIASRSDSSNEQNDYTRNALRLQVMPQIANLFPAYRRALQRFVDLQATEHDFVEHEAIRNFEGVVHLENGAHVLCRQKFLALHLALQRKVIKLLWKCLSEVSALQWSDELSYADVERLRRLICDVHRPNTRIHLPKWQVRVERSYDDIKFFASNGTVLGANWHDVAAKIHGVIEMEEFLLESEAMLGVTPTFAEADEAWFDADRVAFPLHVRTRLDGDRLEPYGMSGSRKLKDLFIDMKLPAAERASVPLVFDGEGRLLWIAGLRRSRHALVDDNTRRLLKITWRVVSDDSMHDFLDV